ncbi:MAG: DNA-binding protein [Rhodobacteraceae bacterium]|jgi:excisionase family DNA binding protein|nr:DNA-binding protein [Paracoccaceae bacterium]
MKNIAHKGQEMKDSASHPQTIATLLGNYSLATAPEIARLCKVSRRTVDNWTKSRRIPFIKIGAAVRFNVPEVMAALGRFTINAVTTR